ncbi:Aspartate--tRNA(Asp/Asn) ligase [Geodia barretti]|uniref:Aspartate--tRNA(Asp/Asn) ligase n=1 Tax=Geodia barretti TaxID=519541 RepID=A0AA35SF10_GEOBA|nr:Aspartate--tRNA(Asp/Asn) ligase [Geodia barretti]
MKTQDCGALRAAHDSTATTLSGWVSRRRDHGGIIFIDLRDRSGYVQIVLNPEHTAERLRSEWCVEVTGTVRLRPEGSENPALPTGEVEVMVEGLTVLNPSLTPPFYITDDVDADESLRLRYRYLDLRRPKMQDNLRLRHQTVKYIRDYLDGHGFLEIETPILIKSTPEGARDYLVPSRTHPGNFYALPQSPQQLKQLLMVSGVERYFQIARCFRDEDLRADRQPEFTQLDLEMSFVEEEDVLGLIEGLYAGLVRELTPQFKIKTPFQRLPYADAMARFGSDKPDLRYGLEMADVSDLAAETEFRVFRGILDRGGIIKAMAVPGKGGLTGADMRRMEDTAKEFGAAGMSHVRLTGDGALDSLTDDDALLSPGLRMPVEWVRRLAERAEAQRGDLILLMAGPARLANQWLAAMRSHLAAQMELADPAMLSFAFVTDFPLFQWDDATERWDSAHHPFTAPAPGCEAMLDGEDLASIPSRAYDLVCNGSELASGSIRIHQRELQEKIFSILGYSAEQISERFGHILEAFDYGAPPHGGIAPGIDRLVAMLAGADSLREVIAFPKTQSGSDLLFGAPSGVDAGQLRDLAIRIVE